MKKSILFATVLGLCSLAQATTIVGTTVNAPSSLVGSDALAGENAYSWGIAITVPAGQQITSAEVDFNNITLSAANSSGTGYLYTDLLNSSKTGVTTASDGDAAGDYWATQFSGANITTLGSQFFASVGTTLSWSYILNATQLAALNSYLTAGIFNLGIDPDCHYTVGNISFTYTEGSTVPDYSVTAYLLGLGLLAVELGRRKLAPAKI